MYSSSKLEFAVSPFENEASNDEVVPTRAEENRNATEEHMGTILLVITLSNIWSLVLVSVPVITSVGSNNLYKYDGWYRGDDILRIIEPVGGLVFNFWIFQSSGIFLKHYSRELQVASIIFMIGAAMYCQGGGLHTASNMFKHPIEDYKKMNPDKYLTDLMYWMRTVWQHIISHYIYASGYALMSAMQAWAFKDVVLLQTPPQKMTTLRALIIFNAVLFALLLSGVAIDFPSGLIVGFLYIGLYGFGIIGRYVYLKDNLTASEFGKRPVLHYFLLSYVLALLIMAIWCASVGGLKKLHDVM